MATERLYVQESASLADKTDDGAYPVVIITEGVGSTGVYSSELMRDDQATLFENAASFMNHPIDPERPWERDVLSIGGRVRNLHVGEDNGRRAILGEFVPRKEYAEFVEEFKDVIALSVFSAINASEQDASGRWIVESFAEIDPYRSVDVVVAAGRGGRFKSATESLRAIESSLGVPQGNKPGATAAPGDRKIMELKDVVDAIKALENTLAPVVSFVNEQKAAAEAAVAEAKAEAKAAEEQVEAAVESYSAAVKAVSEAKLLPSQEADILAAAKAGTDVAPLIEKAKAVIAEAKAAVGTPAPGYVIEGAGVEDVDFSFNFGGRR